MRSRTVAGLLVVAGACSASACTQLLGGFDFNGKGTGGEASGSTASSGGTGGGTGGASGTCDAGADCTPTDSCKAMAIACTTGQPVCTAAGNVPDGTSCGAGLYCNAGTCAPCTASASCVPASKPCDVGTTVCSGGQATCNDTGSPASDGASCGTNQVCKSGLCLQCAAMVPCNPGGNLCQMGQTSCSTGTQVCVSTGAVPDGTSCGTQMTCQGGTCGCATGYLSCSSACVNTQTDGANCGRCGHDCQHGTCSAGKCTPWVIAANRPMISWMDADGKYVVWAEFGPSYQISAAGGSITTITPQPTWGSAAPAAGPVLANGTVAYVSAFGIYPGVYTMAEGHTSGSSQASIPNTYAQAGYIALNPGASTAFLLSALGASPYTNYLLQCPLNGATCTTVGAAIGGYMTTTGIAGGGLVVNNTYAFWDDAYPNSLKRLTLGSNATASFSNSVYFGPKLDANNVYWVGSPVYTLYALPQGFTTTSVPQNMWNTGNTINGLSSDGTNVYFGETNFSAATSLSYIPVGGNAAKAMFTSQNPGSGEQFVVAAGGAVYWVDVNYSACPATANIMGMATP